MKLAKIALSLLLALCLCLAPLTALAMGTELRVETADYTLQLPDAWEGKVLTELRESDGHEILQVYHRASHEKEGAGTLFQLWAWDDLSFVAMPSYMVAGVLTDGETERYLVACLPTDVQAALDVIDEYASLYDRAVFREIFDAIEPREGLRFEPIDPELLAAAQLRFEYANALHIAIGFNELPDGSPIVPEDWDGSMENNRFAIADVDGDGEEELLISVEDSFMAGMMTVVYRLEDYRLVEELRVFPVPEFYEGGIARSYASHNHSYGMSCWPYGLWRFNEETRRFDQFASVYSWDRDISETAYDGSAFPGDADLDGNGTVYSVTDVDGARWLDDADYLAWEARQLGEGEALELEWFALTHDNVDTACGF